MLIVYFGLAWALRTEKHIHMELVVMQLSPRMRRGVELVNTVVCLGLLGYFLVESIEYALFSLELGIRSEWYSGSIMWPFHALIPIGLAMLTIEMIGYFARMIKTKP
ncbi:MAG: TRAP transporter small permease [Deltaproteobacteria bacterium]|nr:TRAP transporter small permease [Deltaproteobacteria bacterium]